MPRPSKTAVPGMTADAVCHWIEQVKAKGLAERDEDVARLIGRSHDTLAAMRLRGADFTTALACMAILKGLEPYSKEAGELEAEERERERLEAEERERERLEAEERMHEKRVAAGLKGAATRRAASEAATPANVPA